ncbi:FmdB family zinc ribbon protein [Pseudohalioglobus lutimaris]|uniref:Transcriptional regulator n=1 Tax=Pseudohalioglobus lutimaris TaxID=1737061 RepID=A0A2N5X0F7_9GAMM|nr:zinc ribbon domain-containing protein [Pseudohalioglobus lutimaris]PLW67983.1 transcriptional regulator [Pseudohalioglobus lutimaris]
MPIYEYQCQKCGGEIEALQKISDAPLTDCPECGAPELKKKVSAAAFRLKGGGWYETDFKTGSKKNLHGAAESAGSAAGDSKKDSKKDSKSDGKTSA